MKDIIKQYYLLIDELNDSMKTQDNIEILSILDKINYHWSKNKQYLINELKNKKEVGAFIGSMSYPHFWENQHFLPLVEEKLLVIDEPFSKMDFMLRMKTSTFAKKSLEVIQHTIDVLLENKDIILKNNIVIIPLKKYYGMEDKQLLDCTNKVIYSILSYMFETTIENDTDFKQLLFQYKSFDDIDKLLQNNKRDMFFLGSEYVNMSIKERLANSYKNEGLDISEIDNIYPIALIHSILFSYCGQVVDIINFSEITNLNVYLFLEIPLFYLVTFLENAFYDDTNFFEKFLKTYISSVLHKCLWYHNYGNLKLEKFSEKYQQDSLISIVFKKYKEAVNQNRIDIAEIHKIVDETVNLFLEETVNDKNEDI